MESLTPNLLIIGAMKCGTSSVAQHLSGHPDIFVPEGKEVNFLRQAENLAPGTSLVFTEIYKKGVNARYRVDASTSYSKFPIRSEVATLAKSVLPKDTRIIYVTRDPVQRAQRHIAHRLGNAELDESELDVTREIEYSALSAYDMQLSFWQRAFSNDQILTIKFEDYLRDPQEVLATVAEFLGLNDMPFLELAQQSANRGNERRSAYRSPLRLVLHSRFYQVLREKVPRTARRKLAHLLLPAAREIDVNLAEVDLQFLKGAIGRLNELRCPTEADVVRVFEECRLS